MSKTVAQDPTLSNVEVNGVKLHAATYGYPFNPPVVVLHGGPGGDFRQLLTLKELADEFFVIFYDQRGSGLSERSEFKEISLENHYADLGAIIDHFAGDRKVALVAHSWGGIIASGYTARNPDRVAKLLLAEPPYLSSEMGIEFSDRVTGKSSFTMIKKVVSAFFRTLFAQNDDKHAQLDLFVSRLSKWGRPTDSPTAGYYCNNDPSTGVAPTWRTGAMAQFLAVSTHPKRGEVYKERFDSIIGDIDKWPGEVLFLAGSCNRLIGPDWQARQMKLFPRAKMVVISQAGHTLFGEQPGQVNAATRAYLGGKRLPNFMKNSAGDGVI